MTSPLINIDLALVHGVNTGETYDYGLYWLESIGTHFDVVDEIGLDATDEFIWLRGTLAGQDYYITAREVRWPSHDNAVTDWLGLRLNAGYRQKCLDHVRHGLATWLVHPPCQGARRLIIAHSMGVPLALDVYWTLLEAIAAGSFNEQWNGDVPEFLGAGGPLTHPVMGRLLESNGLGPPHEQPAHPPPVLSNIGDYICALWSPFGNIWRERPYFERVQVDIQASPAREHDAEKYLALPEAWKYITA